MPTEACDLLHSQIMALLHLASTSHDSFPGSVAQSSPMMLTLLVCLAVYGIWVESLWANLGLGLLYVLGLWWIS